MLVYKHKFAALSLVLTLSTSSGAQIPIDGGDGGFTNPHGVVFAAPGDDINSLMSTGADVVLTIGTHTCMSIDYVVAGQTLQGEGRNSVIDCSGGQPSGQVISTNGMAGVSLRHLTIEGAPGGGVDSELFRVDAPNVRIQNVGFSGSDAEGVVVFVSGTTLSIDGCDFIGAFDSFAIVATADDTAVGNTVFSGHSTSINVSSTVGFTVHGNTRFLGVSTAITGALNEGLKILGSTLFQTKITVTGTQFIIASNLFVLPLSNSPAISTNGGMSNTAILGNTFVGAVGVGQRAIDFFSGSDFNRVVGNIAVDVSIGGDPVYFIRSGADDNTFRSNSYQGNGTTLILDQGARNNWDTSVSGNWGIKTNFPSADMHIEDVAGTNTTVLIKGVSGQVDSMLTVEDAGGVVFEILADGLLSAPRTSIPSTCDAAKGGLFVNTTSDQICFCSSTDTFTCVP